MKRPVASSSSSSPSAASAATSAADISGPSVSTMFSRETSLRSFVLVEGWGWDQDQALRLRLGVPTIFPPRLIPDQQPHHTTHIYIYIPIPTRTEHDDVPVRDARVLQEAQPVHQLEQELAGAALREAALARGPPRDVVEEVPACCAKV